MSSDNPKKYDLKSVLEPKSVAIIGASSKPGKIGYQLVKNLVSAGFKGNIYPVNPKGGEMFGLKMWPSVKDIPEPVDLAGIVLPTKFVIPTIKDCIEVGVKGLVIYSAGFAEIGGEGIKAQEELKALIENEAIRVLGPNINGIVNASINLNMNFNDFGAFGGNWCMLTQSGAFGSGMVFRGIYEHGLKLNKFIPLGNKVDINEIEGLEYLEEDEDTKVISMYLEAFKDVKKFVEVAKRVSKKKPIVMLKVGVTEGGKEAVKHHTASIAESPDVVDAALKEAGVIRVHGVDEMVDAVAALSQMPLPKGPRVAIVTNAGGLGVLSSDLIESLGLELARFTDETKAELRKVVPPFGSVANPVDLTASIESEALTHVIELVLKDPNVDALIFTGQQSSFLPVDTFVKPCVANRELAKELGKCFLVVVTGAFLAEVSKEFRDNGFPTYPTPERAVRTILNLYRYNEWLKRA
jgi:acyl-CoA synthetase (NDP forming)